LREGCRSANVGEAKGSNAPAINYYQTNGICAARFKVELPIQ
jgi:hypothetical protein